MYPERGVPKDLTAANLHHLFQNADGPQQLREDEVELLQTSQQKLFGADFTETSTSVSFTGLKNQNLQFL